MRLPRRRSSPPPPARAHVAEPDATADLARLVEAVSLLPLGVVVEDAQGRTIASNERAQHPAGDLQGDVLADGVLRRVIARARAGSAATETLELRSVPPRILDLAAVPLASGGVLATVSDQSERHRLDAIRRDFVANVNHELRTPIGALALLAEALLEETDPATVRRLAGRVSVEADRATNLLSDLLDFSRVEDEAPAAPERLALASVVLAAADRVQAHAERRQVRVSLPVGGPDVEVDGDRGQLVSAVSNLLDNAVKYSDAGSQVEVTISRASGFGEVAVRDQGCGIPARDLDRIFERFYRVDRARTRGTGGTGLGLAIVRHVAGNHGGEIIVESLEGAGSTFTLRLPAVDQ